MSKEKLASLGKYVDNLKGKLSDKTLPEKHKNREATYRQFLTNEIARTSATIDAIKSSGTPEAKK